MNRLDTNVCGLFVLRKRRLLQMHFHAMGNLEKSVVFLRNFL